MRSRGILALSLSLVILLKIPPASPSEASNGLVSFLVTRRQGSISFVQSKGFQSESFSSSCTGCRALLASNISSSSSEMPSYSNSSSLILIQNYREAALLKNVIRCAKPDANIQHLEKSELILDLRSDAERAPGIIQKWKHEYPELEIQRDELKSLPEESKNRVLLLLDLLNSQSFMKYLEEHWMTPSQKAQATLYRVISGDKLHELRINILNEKGLAGLNEAILETGKPILFQALRAMTLVRERNPESIITIHCVQGKDRTGLLVMLCQYIANSSLDQNVVVNDYHISEEYLLGLTESAVASAAVANRAPTPGRLNKQLFSRTPKKAMVATINYLNTRYGSIEGYLNNIGFDKSWRERLSPLLQIRSHL